MTKRFKRMLTESVSEIFEITIYIICLCIFIGMTIYGMTIAPENVQTPLRFIVGGLAGYFAITRERKP